MAERESTSSGATGRSVQAAVAAWIIPGAGHFLLGHRALAVLFFIAISFPFAVGLALGGVKNYVNPRTNKWLFLAELPIAGYTVPAYLAGQAVDRSVTARMQRGEEVDLTEYVAYYPASDVAQIYLATAGLLNILAILDAVSRAQTGGLPTFHRHLPDGPPSEAGT